jgi:hypothetical protein
MTAPKEPIVVPDDMAELSRWAVWRMEMGRKVPYQTNGARASCTNTSHWRDLGAAQETLSSGTFSGLAFAFFKEDGLVGIDLDDSLDMRGDLHPAFRGVVERFADTYIEISPSGNGLKIWARGSLPANVGQVTLEAGGVEMYDHARYFTFTGRRFRGAPLDVEDHAKDVLDLYNHLAAPNKRTWPLQPLPGGRIPHGQQHSTLVSIAGTLRARGVCDQAIEACLQEINRRQCERPGPTTHITQIVRSTRRWHRGSV